MFRDNLLVPPSKAKQFKKNVRNTWVRSYIGNGVGAYWFTENVTLVHGLVEGGGLGRG